MTGLAITTISRALNNAPELAQDTRERVQRIAAEIGYLPDRAALRLKTGRTNVISMADGVIFSRTEPDDARVKLLQEHNFAFVSHGRTEVATPHPYVDYDNVSFAYHAVRRLVAKGRKKITIILPPPAFTFGKHLREGFMRAIGEAGVQWEIPKISLDNSADEIRERVIARIGEPGAPDGYVCSGDAAAVAVMAGITDSGRVIGRDVDMVAKQTSEIFSQVRPRVDAIYEDTALAGEQMGQLLMRRIAGEPAENLQILQVPEIKF